MTETVYFCSHHNNCFLKKLAAILLLGLFLFQWAGYQALYSYRIQQADEQLEARLDKADYNMLELETIAIPLHLPYLYNQATYERTTGEIKLNGITYKYVQRRVWHDSLYLQCLPNYEAMRLNTAQNDYFQATTDFQHPNSSFSKMPPAASKHFVGGIETFSFYGMTALSADCLPLFVAYSQPIPFCYAVSGPDQPPEG